jgi:hypothetical protein
MTIDQIIGIAGLVIGIVGIALARHFYVKTIRNKQLVIGISEPVPTNWTSDGPLYKVFFLLWNKWRAFLRIA